MKSGEEEILGLNFFGKNDIKKVVEEIDVSIDGEEGKNMDVTIEFINGKLKIFC